MSYKTINWDVIEDELDEYVWDKATAQYWLDTRVPVSNDLRDWRTLSGTEKSVINRVVGGLACWTHSNPKKESTCCGPTFGHEKKQQSSMTF